MDDDVPRIDLDAAGDGEIDLLADGHDDARGRWSRRRRRALAMVCAVVLVSAVGARQGVRSREHAEAAWLARAWATRAAYDSARSTALERVTDRAVNGDQPVVARGVSAVDREEAAALSRLADVMGARLLVSSRARAVRREVVAALRAEAADLVTAAGSGDGRLAFPPAILHSSAVVRRADARLQALVRRNHLTVTAAAAPQFHGADQVAAALAALVDVPTGLRLLVTSAVGVRAVDLDSGTSTPAPTLPADGAAWTGPSARHQRPSQRCTDVLGSTPERVASAPCGDRTRFAVTDEATGHAVAFAMPDGAVALTVLLQPRGHRLAVQAATRDGVHARVCWSDDRDPVVRCAAADDGTVATSWSSDGRWLLLSRGRTYDDDQLLLMLLDTRDGREHRVRLHSPRALAATIAR